MSDRTSLSPNVLTGVRITANACMGCPPVPFSPALNLQEPGVYQVCDGAYDDEAEADVEFADGDGEVDAYVGMMSSSCHA